jgi:hypothetical protein
MCLPQKGALMVATAVSLLWPLHIAPVLVPGLFFHLWHGFLLRVCAYWTLRKGFPIALFIGFVILAAQRGSLSATCALTASVILVVGIMGNSIA